MLRLNIGFAEHWQGAHTGDDDESKVRTVEGAGSSPPAIPFASLILVCLTIIALGAAASFTERGIVVRRDWVIHSYQVRSHLNDLQLEGVRAQPTKPIFSGWQVQQSLPPSAEQADLARQTVFGGKIVVESTSGGSVVQAVIPARAGTDGKDSMADA